MDRVKRLRKLLAVQEKIKALHETRHAGFAAAATAAAAEASELASRFDAAGSMAELFPDLYSRHIDAALSRRDESLRAAASEAEKVATATARTNMVERDYRDARRDHERVRGDRERLEAIESLAADRSASK